MYPCLVDQWLIGQGRPTDEPSSHPDANLFDQIIVGSYSILPRNICRHWRTIAHTAARIFNVPTLRAFPQTPTLLRPANSIFPSGSTPRSHPPLALGLRWSLVSRGKEKERPRAKRKARVCGAISRERMSLYMSYKSAPHETSRVLHVFSCDTVVSCHFFCNLFPETCL